MKQIKVKPLLRIACILIFLGWGWLHLLGDIPFRAIFWDESLLKGIVEGLSGMTWKEWVSSRAVNNFVQNLIYLTGVFYLLCGFAAFRLNEKSKWAGRMLLLGALSLMFLAFLFYKEKFYHLGQFFEYTIQWSAPLLLFLVVRKKWTNQRLLLPIKIAVALTFTCHGLYAVGYYPVPGNFVDMIIGVLGVSENTATTILTTVGILDFILSVLIFLPGKWAVPALSYAVLWGTATALARVTGYFDIDFAAKAVIRWLPETLLRLSHGLLPFIAILIILKNKNAIQE